jgi:hypothetical protein
MKSKFKAFFSIDATWKYWAIIIKKKNVYKTKFVSSHEQWVYLKMNTKLIESSYIYVQFTNLIFESLSIIEEFSAQKIIINDHEKTIMTSFVNDHSKAKVTFEALFDFLHQHYFSRTIFDLIYLSSKKTIAFTKKLNMIEFTKEFNELKSFVKYKTKILEWFIFINKAKLNDFLWLTFFLRQFISKRVDHVLIIKKTYMIQVSTKSTQIKLKMKVKECDKNLTKASRFKRTNTTVTMCQNDDSETIKKKKSTFSKT